MNAFKSEEKSLPQAVETPVSDTQSPELLRCKVKHFMENAFESPSRGNGVQQLTFFFFIAMLTMFPLFIDDGYFNIVDAKFLFFILHLAAFCFGLLILSSYSLFCRSSKTMLTTAKFSSKEFSVLLFAFACTLSCLLSQYPLTSFLGTLGRYNGLLFSLCCCAVLFFASRLLRTNEVYVLMPLFLISASIVCILATLNYFGLDPLRVFTNIRLENQHIYLSTIGNINFFSSFLCLALPYAIYRFIADTSQKINVFYFVVLGILIVGLLCANSDSGYLGVAATILAIVCLPGFSIRQFSRVCLLGHMFFMFSCFFGIADYIFPNRTHQIRGLSVLLTFPPVSAFAAIIFFGIFVYLNKKTTSVPSLAEKSLAKAGRIVVLALIVGFVVLLVLVNTLWKNWNLGVLENILRFSDHWGSDRGYLWKALKNVYVEFFSIFERLFGTGPDTVIYQINPHYSAYIKALSGLYFDSAHNEYLHHLIGIGLFGLLCYISMLTAHFKGLFNKTSNPTITALRLSVLAYAVQAFFNIAMPVVLPLLFIFLGFIGNISDAPHLQENKNNDIAGQKKTTEKLIFSPFLSFFVVEICLIVTIKLLAPVFFSLARSLL